MSTNDSTLLSDLASDLFAAQHFTERLALHFEGGGLAHPEIALTTEEGAAAARAAWRLIDAVLERIDHARDDPPPAAFHLLDTPAGQIAVTADGCWFEYADADDAENMHPVVQPDEAVYAYSHGGVRYRAAIEAIATWKESSGWGVTTDRP